MATVNFSRHEILSKIVYYGPGMCGKTTNLQTIHSKVPEKLRGNLTSVATQQDRTLFFDLLPIEIGKIKEFTLRLQIYTVPGQVYYNASRKIVLRGVDGIIFVADSQVGKMEENIESLTNLCDNLRTLGIDPDTVPVVLQYNKRDLSPIYTVEELNKALNERGYAFFEAIALTGHGVFDTLKAISTLVVKDIRQRLEQETIGNVPPVVSAPPLSEKPARVETAERVEEVSEEPRMTAGERQPVAVEPEPVGGMPVSEPVETVEPAGFGEPVGVQETVAAGQDGTEPNDGMAVKPAAFTPDGEHDPLEEPWKAGQRRVYSEGEPEDVSRPRSTIWQRLASKFRK